MGFEYKERSEESYKQRATQRNFDGRDGIFKQGVKSFTPKAGKNKVRILPPTWKEPQHYGIDTWVHYGIGPESSAFLCPKKMKNQPCPICEDLANPKVREDKEFFDAVKEKKRVLVYILDRNDEAAGIKVWSMPAKLDRTFVMQATDDDIGKILRIDHPIEGYDVVFERNGEGVKTQYEGVSIARVSTPIVREASKLEEILDIVVEQPLPEVLDYHDYNYIKSAYEGKVAPEKEPAPEKEETETAKNVKEEEPEPSEDDELAKMKELYKKKYSS